MRQYILHQWQSRSIGLQTLTHAPSYRYNFKQIFQWEREREREKKEEKERERESLSMRTLDIGRWSKRKNEGYVVGVDTENIYDYFPDIKASD